MNNATELKESTQHKCWKRVKAHLEMLIFCLQRHKTLLHTHTHKGLGLLCTMGPAGSNQSPGQQTATQSERMLACRGHPLFTCSLCSSCCLLCLSLAAACLLAARLYGSGGNMSGQAAP